MEKPSLFLASNNKVIYRLLFSLKKSEKGKEKEKREVNIEYYYASKTKKHCIDRNLCNVIFINAYSLLTNLWNAF